MPKRPTEDDRLSRALAPRPDGRRADEGRGVVSADELARKASRQRATPAEPAPQRPAGNLPPGGHTKVTMNLRGELWAELRAQADEAGTPPVTIIEALVTRYLNDPRLGAQINATALDVGRERRRLARRARDERNLLG